MVDDKNILTQDKDEMTQSATKPISIRMSPGEQTGQPIYSNFASVNAGQGVVIVDFGFLDSQNLNTLNRVTRSGEALPDAINGKMSSRMAISIDTAHHLSQQLNQLLCTKPSATVAQGQQSATDSVLQASSSSSTAAVDSRNAQKSDKGGFRFPWSKKTD